MAYPAQITSPPQVQAEVVLNENLDAIAHQAVYAKKASTTTGLTWGYYGGRWGGFSVSDGTLTLTNSATNYVVVEIATGVASVSTSNTDWNNTTDYVRVYQLTVAGGVVTAAQDHRAGPGGVHGGTGTGGGGGGGTAGTLNFDTDGTLASNSDTLIPTQKAVKTYTDAKLAGLSWKQAVRAATTTAGTLASSFENGDSIDGVTLATGDRILIKNQASGSENGIYVVAASGAPTRSTDADSGAELVNASIYVSEGTTLADTQWTCSTNAPITVNSTALVFAQLTAGGGGSLTNWTEAVNTSSPNATVPVTSFAATNAATNVDAALIAKGSGASLAQVPDSSTTGGDKRGVRATDWQKSRAGADQVASGSDSTISGGKDNKASGSSASVGGGTGNTASGTQSTVSGGNSNTAAGTNATTSGGSSNNNSSSGTANTIGGGASNTISGSGSNGVIAGGNTNTVSAPHAVIGGGEQNTADGVYSSIQGGYRATTRGIRGARPYANASVSVNSGEMQDCTYNIWAITTNNTTTPLSADGSTPAADTSISMPTSSTYAFHALVSARQNSTHDGACWEVKGAIKNTNSGTCSIVGTVTVTALGADAGASAWTVTAVANDTLDSLEFQVTGENSKTIRWGCVVKTMEVKG